MNPVHVTYKDAEIAYYRYGRGQHPVFCFHGYGEDARSFQFLDSLAGTDFSFFAIDLPLHGNTRWNVNEDFTCADLQQIMDRIMEKESGPSLSFAAFDLMGFSLGGRMSLALFENNPSPIRKLILLAPDGLKVNFWYWFATQTLAGKKLFRFTMIHPRWFFSMLGLFRAVGIVNKSIVKFVRYYIDNPHLREELYGRWIVLRRIRPRLYLIKKEINRQHTPVRIIYGRHDRIILPGPGYRFREGIEAHCTITVIASGHQVLHEKHAKEILFALRQ